MCRFTMTTNNIELHVILEKDNRLDGNNFIG